MRSNGNINFMGNIGIGIESEVSDKLKVNGSARNRRKQYAEGKSNVNNNIDVTGSINILGYEGSSDNLVVA